MDIFLLSAQTGTPNFDTFFSRLFMVVTCEQMTIKHSIYMWKKYPFYIQKGPVCFYSGIKIHPRKK